MCDLNTKHTPFLTSCQQMSVCIKLNKTKQNVVDMYVINEIFN